VKWPPNLPAFDAAFCYLHTYARQESLAFSRRPNLANFELCPVSQFGISYIPLSKSADLPCPVHSNYIDGLRISARHPCPSDYFHLVRGRIWCFVLEVLLSLIANATEKIPSRLGLSTARQDPHVARYRGLVSLSEAGDRS
jgi:hypothetical protein